MGRKKTPKENAEPTDAIRPVTREQSKRNKGLSQLNINMPQEVLKTVGLASNKSQRVARKTLYKPVTPPQITYPTMFMAAATAAVTAMATEAEIEAKTAATEAETTSTVSKKLRCIIIDGSNVALTHGKEKGVFSSLGIKLVVDFFISRGHSQVQALVPQFRRSDYDVDVRTDNFDILDDLEASGKLRYIPTTLVDGKLLAPTDCDIILKGAMHFNAVIVSNDDYANFRKDAKSQEFLDANRLSYLFIFDDFFVPNPAPLGNEGPPLREFLAENLRVCNSQTRALSGLQQQTPIEQLQNDYDDQDHEFKPDVVFILSNKI